LFDNKPFEKCFDSPDASIYTCIVNGILLVIVSLGLFVGGIVLLALGIPFWSQLLGIGAVQVGIVLVILTFELFFNKRNKPLTNDYRTVSCLACGAAVFVPRYMNVALCDNCQVRFVRAIKSIGLLVFMVFSVASGVFLVQQDQNITEKAFEEIRRCEDGSWLPASCKCGLWVGSSPTRACEDGMVRKCILNSDKVWVCD
jgi:hypothetical protein